MARPSNQPGEQKVHVDAANAPEQESSSMQRIPFKWRLVFAIWLVSAVLLVLYEAMVNFSGLFNSTSK
jgi:hypothetical protein